MEAFKHQFPNHSIFKMWQFGGNKNPVLDKTFGAPAMTKNGDDEQTKNSLSWFENTMSIAQNVGLIEVHNTKWKGAYLFTGFIIGKGYVIGPSHALQEDSYLSSLFYLNYLDNNTQKKPLKFEPGSFITNTELNYSIVKLNEEAIISLSKLLATSLNKEYQFNIDEDMTIISHMLGKPQKIHSGTIKGSWNEKLFYDTTSDLGSSGAPIIVNGKVVAMHVANGKRVPDGLQVDANGRKEQWQMGIQIGAILEDAKLDF